MSPTNKNLPSRLPEFDVLRSLAIIGVVIIHITAPLELYAHNGIFLYYLFVVLHLSQRFCVPVFLIISGFFLSYNPNYEHNPTLVLKKRLTRIIPPYIIWSIVFYLLDVFLGDGNFNLLILLQQIVTGSAVGAYYFVILIIQFYILWWLATKFKIFKYDELLLISTAIQLLVTTYLYYCLFNIHYFPSIAIVHRFIGSWSFYFIFGLFLGKNYDATKRVLAKIRKLLLLITLVLLVLSVVEFNLIAGLDLLYSFKNQIVVSSERLETAISYWRISSQLYSVAFFLLIISFHNTKLFAFSSAKFFSKISEYSFAIYLIHQPIIWKIFFRVFKIFGTGSLTSFLVILATDLGVCYSLIYLGCKFLPRKYTRYVFGV